jgi:hypothetical protein
VILIGRDSNLNPSYQPLAKTQQSSTGTGKVTVLLLIKINFPIELESFLDVVKTFAADREKFPSKVENVPAGVEKFPANVRTFPGLPENLPGHAEKFSQQPADCRREPEKFPKQPEVLPPRPKSFPKPPEVFPITDNAAASGCLTGCAPAPAFPSRAIGVALPFSNDPAACLAR